VWHLIVEEKGIQYSTLILIKLPCCIKLALQIISWGRCTIKQTSNASISQIHFGIKLYMFRIVPLSNISCLALYTHQWYVSYRLCWLLASEQSA